jgi:tRNA (Thr-GGU) A37 N-methylase
MYDRNESLHVLKNIGVLCTPYVSEAPYQPVKDEKSDFSIVLNKKYADGLKLLNTFKYIYVVYYLDKVIRGNDLLVSSPWAKDIKVGVFASRSPDRPNPIGISIVETMLS